ncbi:MAG: hypothetical protein KC431_17230 [Myxococcales bacterium]|nr:hypothetical protein [Myxococcales bacterium]
MRRLASLLTVLILVGISTTALADVQPPDSKGDGDKAEEKADGDKAGEKTDKTAEKADEKADDTKSGSCSISDDNGAIFGTAALVLLVSGVGLRRTRKS